MKPLKNSTVHFCKRMRVINNHLSITVKVVLTSENFYWQPGDLTDPLPLPEWYTHTRANGTAQIRNKHDKHTHWALSGWTRAPKLVLGSLPHCCLPTTNVKPTGSEELGRKPSSSSPKEAGGWLTLTQRLSGRVRVGMLCLDPQRNRWPNSVFGALMPPPTLVSRRK